jgi:hypothetical protein
VGDRPGADRRYVRGRNARGDRRAEDAGVKARLDRSPLYLGEFPDLLLGSVSRVDDMVV